MLQVHFVGGDTLEVTNDFGDIADRLEKGATVLRLTKTDRDEEVLVNVRTMTWVEPWEPPEPLAASG
jgi:hypothetical protein